MTPEDVIKEVQENASEWLEHATDPASFIAGILAHRIVQLNNHITYLQRVLKNVSSSASYRS